MTSDSELKTRDDDLRGQIEVLAEALTYIRDIEKPSSSDDPAWRITSEQQSEAAKEALRHAE